MDKVGDILKGFFEKIPAFQHATDVATLWRVWDRDLKLKFGAWTRLDDFKDGRLIILVTQGVPMHNVSFMGQEIRNTLNTAVGKELVQEVVFRRRKS